MQRSSITLKLYTFSSNILNVFFKKNSLKLNLEYFYWWLTNKQQKGLKNLHFEEFFTSHFNIEKSFYTDLKILDIGCGPRGSLEWAENSETYGVDPLINKYKKFGISNHKTTYVNANCESLPFEKSFFDVVSSFNSLDHVDDLDKSITEIKRVIKPGGLFLLMCDIHQQKTVCEPSPINWDIAQKFAPDFKVILEHHFEGNNFYQSIREKIPYNHLDSENRYGILVLKLQKIDRENNL